MEKRDVQYSALYKLGEKTNLIYYCSDKTRQDTMMNVVLCLMVDHLKTVALRKA